jgi:RES domain-containing protein
MAEGEGATEGMKRRGDKIIVEYFPETEFEQLRRRLAALLTSVESYYGVVFRSSEPTYATKDNLLTGQGSRKYGGRWNPPASFATVYAAISDATALAESKAHHLYS